MNKYITLLIMIFMSLVSFNLQAETNGTKINFKNDWTIYPIDTLNNTNLSWNQIGLDNAKEKRLKGYAAKIPNTILKTLVDDGYFGNVDIFKGDNYLKINDPSLLKPWVYSNSFIAPRLLAGDHLILKLEGVNYMAKLAINGNVVSIDSQDTYNQIINPFIIYNIDVSKYVKPGVNSITFLVSPPYCSGEECEKQIGKYTADFSVGFVDWAPVSVGNFGGFYRPIKLEVAHQGVNLTAATIATQLQNNNAEAIITPQVYVNYFNTTANQYKIVAKLFDRGSEVASSNELINIESSGNINLSRMLVANPKLWWPFTMGTPFLYELQISIYTANGKLLQQTKQRVGVRQIETGVTAYASGYYRYFKINGKDLQIRGSGWTDGMLLNDSYADTLQKLIYVKDMNLNTIRLEGFWGSDQTLYDLADQMGILIFPGWSCVWDWSYYVTYRSPSDPNLPKCDDIYGCILTSDDNSLITAAFKSQLLYLRAHPSIIAWMVDSDHQPTAALEQKYDKLTHELDGTRENVISAAEVVSTISQSQKAGLKMRGPYAYEPPRYWYQDKKYGGAFGFNSEVGVGGSLPSKDSMQRMFYPDQLTSPYNNPVWDFHVGPYTFHSLDQYFNPELVIRYGSTLNLDDYLTKANLMGYEATRGMFEATAAAKTATSGSIAPATGIIQWMLSGPWPKLYWQLFDYYLQPTASYYAAKLANRKIHVMYNYDNKLLYINNDNLFALNNLQLKVKVYDALNDTQAVFESSLPISIGPNQSLAIANSNIPQQVLDAISGNNYYLDITLNDTNANEIDNNFYWLSKKDDQLDYANTLWFVTPIAPNGSADFTSMLNYLEQHKVNLVGQCQIKNNQLYLELANNSKHYSVFNDLTLVGSSQHVLWSDNYISIAPQQQKQITAQFNNGELVKSQYYVAIHGLNSDSVIQCY
ncbi:MAG: hypothetical protein ORN24_01170 [Burkholderiales bacterium]|nr:hypothetical protein [Burkholderiales bacterium]